MRDLRSVIPLRSESLWPVSSCIQVRNLKRESCPQTAVYQQCSIWTLIHYQTTHSTMYEFNRPLLSNYYSWPIFAVSSLKITKNWLWLWYLKIHKLAQLALLTHAINFICYSTEMKRETAAYSSILAWKIPQKSLMGACGLAESNTTETLSTQLKKLPIHLVQ